MGRPAIPDEEADKLVHPEADRMVGAGQKPRAHPIRLALVAAGHAIGWDRVQRALERWEEKQPPKVVPTTEPLPADLLAYLARWLNDERVKLQHDWEARITELTVNRDDLRLEIDELRRHLQESKGQIERLTSERDSAAGQVKLLTDERQDLAKQLDETQKDAHAQRNEVARLTNSEDTARKELAALREGWDQMVTASAQEREARIAADKALSGERGTLTELRKHADALETQRLAAVAHGQDLERRLASAFEALNQAVGAARAAEAAQHQLGEELKHRREEIDRARGDLTRAYEEVRTAQAPSSSSPKS
jgi:chromosome segregation ATPase